MIRLGTVPYLAARPLVEGLDDDPRFAVTRAVPAELVEKLRAGELDCALVSSIEAFRRPGYRYAPSAAIVGDGAVRSVLLFARCPLEEVTSLALDPASRAGAVLGEIALTEITRRRPRVAELARGVDPAKNGADAYVRIGDAALREGAAPPLRTEAHDLAALWKRITGLPFVFAVWLIRPSAPFGAEHAAALKLARDRGCARRREIAADAARTLALPEQFVAEYLVDVCRYDLDAPNVARGFEEFGRRAAELGLADRACVPSVMPS